MTHDQLTQALDGLPLSAQRRREAFGGYVRLIWEQDGRVTGHLYPDAPCDEPVLAALAHVRALGLSGESLVLAEEWDADAGRYRVVFDRAVVEAEEFD